MLTKEPLQKAPNCYSESFKRELIEYYLSHNYTKYDVWRKFTGYEREHGQIIVWMRKLGYIKKECKNRAKLASMYKGRLMTKKDTTRLGLNEADKQIAELKKRLEETEIKAIAYSKMIDIAEDKFKIAIRKKSNTKL